MGATYIQVHFIVNYPNFKVKDSSPDKKIIIIINKQKKKTLGFCDLFVALKNRINNEPVKLWLWSQTGVSNWCRDTKLVSQIWDVPMFRNLD